MIDQRERALICLQFGEQRFDELVQVIDLLQFASAVLVQLAVARQDVQLLEQLDGLTGADFRNAGKVVGLGARCLLHAALF